MQNNNVWTAVTRTKLTIGAVTIAAQDKSSKHNLKNRLLKDDPIWHKEMKFIRMPKFKKKHFKHGLALVLLNPRV